MRWLVAGYGDIVVRRGLPALRDLGEDVVALAGRRHDRARAVAERFGVPAAADLDAPWPAADAVYIATPVVSHVPLARAALRSGLHVLVEKPVAGALDDAGADLVDLAARGDRTIGVAYYRRLDPTLNAVRDALRGRGAHRVTVDFRVTIDFRTDFAPPRGHPMQWRTDRAVAGGGVLADAGSHRVDLLCWLLGAPVTVRATLSGHHPAGGERQAALRMEWPGRGTADATFGWAAGPPVDRLHVRTDVGQFRLDPLDGTATAGTNRHLPLFADFVDAVTHRRPPACPLAEALLVDRIIRCAERSHAADGAPVAV